VSVHPRFNVPAVIGGIDGKVHPDVDASDVIAAG